MPYIDLELRIGEGDLLLVDGEAYRVATITDEGEPMVALTRAGKTAKVQESERIREWLAGAEQVTVCR